MKSFYSSLLLILILVGCASNTPALAPAVQPQLPTTPPSPVSNPLTTHASARQCMALAMYWEARGEGRLGMTAVGAVISNRVASDQFPDDYCSVVYQGGETPPCQFSWWCDGKSDRPNDQRQWALALDTAEEYLAGSAEDPTNGALFFHSTAIKQPWRRKQTARIGGHVFYR